MVWLYGKVAFSLPGNSNALYDDKSLQEQFLTFFIPQPTDKGTKMIKACHQFLKICTTPHTVGGAHIPQ